MTAKVARIVAPDTPKWVRPFVDANELTAASVIVGVVALVALILSCGLLIAGPLVARLLGGLLGAATVGGMTAGIVAANQRSVTPGAWSYKGKPIVGEAQALLIKAATQAAEAEQFVTEIPTRLDWAQFRPHVEALLWDAAGHAAQVCQLNEQLNRLKYAEPGTPQGVVHADLWRRRQEHLQVVARASDETLRLARATGNAAAAAQVALERSGSVYDLEVVSPSAPALIAEGGLAEAHTQLRILTEAWSEVDTSTALLAAKLDEEFASRPTRRGPRGRRSQPPSGRQQEG